MAIRQRGLARHVIGIGRRRSSLRAALDVGAVDEVSLDLREGVEAADVIVLATPIGAMLRLAGPVARHAKGGAVLTDVASTKQRVIQTLTAALRDRPDVAYVPAHPMAGSEQRGAENARAALFEGSVCILTPLPEATGPPLSRVRGLWEGVGATVREMAPADHDRLVARISHLPHLAAAALLHTISAEEGMLAGSGLVDTTRVASGDPSLWRGICETNPEQVAAALDSYVEVLRRIRSAIADGRFTALEQALREAKDKRDGLLAARRQ